MCGGEPTVLFWVLMGLACLAGGFFPAFFCRFCCCPTAAVVEFGCQHVVWEVLVFLGPALVMCSGCCSIVVCCSVHSFLVLLTLLPKYIFFL